MRRVVRDDRGAVLPMFAICLVVLMAMSAFAVDLGLLFTERRQTQGAADTGALGGALDLPGGIAAASEASAEIIRNNLHTTYSDAEWAALWGSCIDGGSLAFSGTVLGASTDCISFDGLGRYRVVVPDQEIEAVFAQVVGKETFNTSAFAEVQMFVPGVGGVLPFAVLSNAPSGTEICMRSSATGTATPPCTGSEEGNFGALQVAQWGNPAYNTQTLTCNLNKSDQLQVNLSVGIDHFITRFAGTEIVDTCAKPFGPNTLSTFQGVAGGLFEGLVSGDVVQGVAFPGRLSRGQTTRISITQKGESWQIDNVPLWEYIGYGKTGRVPDSCTREAFDATVLASGHAAAEAQMTTCFAEFQSGAGFDVLFDRDANDDGEPDIVGSPRYGAVPQFFETSFPSGGSENLHILDFRAVFLNGLYFGCTGTACDISYTPGSTTGTLALPNGGSPLDQVSGYLLPNGTLPSELIENGINGSLGAFQTRLSR